jgi:hypothetical protein
MDVTKYMGSAFLKVEDIRNAHREVRIKNCEPGQFDKLDLTFDDGDKLSLNTTNVRTLARAFGRDDRDWLGKTVELYIGKTEYGGEEQDSILVRPISPPAAEKRSPDEPDAAASKPAAPRRFATDLDDEIPF